MSMGPQTLDPTTALLEMVFTGLVTQRAIYAAVKLGIPDALADEEADSSRVAQAVGAHPRAAYRLLRTLSNAGIVTESSDGTFVLTPIGQLLRRDVPGSMRAVAMFCGEPFYLQAWERIVHSIRTGTPAWNEVHGMPFFDYLRTHRDSAQILTTR